jgi:hypothetical protein
MVRAWLGGPLWDMESPDADEYFGKALRTAADAERRKGNGNSGLRRLADEIRPAPPS